MDNRKSRTVLTQEQKASLIEDLKAGLKLADVATKYGVSVPTVSKIKKNQGLTRGGSAVDSMTHDTKTISVPTTQTALENLVKKVSYGFIKNVKGDHDTVEVDVIFKIGSKEYTFEKLVEMSKKKAEDAMKQKRIAELEAEIAALKAK